MSPCCAAQVSHHRSNYWTYVCLIHVGFGTAISSTAPSLGGTLTTAFGATQGLGSSTFGQQPTTGTKKWLRNVCLRMFVSVDPYCAQNTCHNIIACHAFNT